MLEMESGSMETINKKKGSSWKIWFGLVALVIAGIWLFNSANSKTWTLFIYKSATPNADEQKARIDTYKSQTECIEKGVSFTSKGGSFECGYDCKYDGNYLIEVCGKVCGRNGCRD